MPKWTAENFKQIKLRPHKTQQQQTTSTTDKHLRRLKEKKTKKKQQKWPKSATDKKLVDTKLYTHCIMAIWA